MGDKYQLRRQLFDNLALLVKSEQLEILKILKNNNENFTENSNGIFFDVLLIGDKSYEEMNSFMEFCLKTRKEDSIRSQTLKEMAAECGTALD
jgi:hypothetical protein